MKKAITMLAAMLMVIQITSAQWVEMGGGTHPLNANNIIFSVVTDVSGNVYAAGEFSDTLTHYYYVAKWVGDSAWVKLGTLNANGYIYSLTTDAAGNVYAAGAFTDDQYQASGNLYVAKWDGTTWSKLGANGVARVPNTAGSAIYSISVDPSGNVYAAGIFKNANNHYYVSKWNGTAWSELGGTNALKANYYIHNVVADAAGNVYAAGAFTDSPNYRYHNGILLDSTGYKYVAKWNGSTWSELGTGTNALNTNSPISALTVDPAGAVYVAYADSFLNFNVASWDGTNWVPTGALNASNSINALTTNQAGHLYAAGNFQDVNGSQYVAEWDGTKWFELGTGTNSLNPNSYILTIATDTASNVYAAGYFTDGNNTYWVAKYDPNNQGPNGVADIKSSISDVQISPNPAAGSATLLLSAPAMTTAIVELYDMTGREITTLYNGDISAGAKTIVLNTEAISTGVYLIKVSDGKSTIQKRFVKI